MTILIFVLLYALHQKEQRPFNKSQMGLPLLLISMIITSFTTLILYSFLTWGKMFEFQFEKIKYIKIEDKENVWHSIPSKKNLKFSKGLDVHVLTLRTIFVIVTDFHNSHPS